MSPSRLQQELKQSKPFESTSQELYLSIVRTADVLLRVLEQRFKAVGLTTTQYNVLRILRGAGEAGLPCSEIGRRLVSSVPDVTRLLDRMEQRGLVKRERSKEDRRVVSARIEEKGLELCEAAGSLTKQFYADFLDDIPEAMQQRLIEDLESVRCRAVNSESAE